MPDVKGLLADPDFQKLDLSTQKSTLGKLDPDFASISDGDYLQFRTKLKGSMGGATMDWGKARVPTEQELETTGGGPKGNANDFLGLGVGKIAESGVKALAEGGLKRLASKVAVPLATGATTGYLGKKGAQAVGVPEAGANVIGVLTGLAGGILEGKIGNFVRSIPDEVIGSNSWLKLAKWMASDEGEIATAKLPKQTRDEIAFQTYKEDYGKEPTTGREKLQAIKNFKDGLKTEKEAKVATPKQYFPNWTPPKPKPAPKSEPAKSYLQQWTPPDAPPPEKPKSYLQQWTPPEPKPESKPVPAPKPELVKSYFQQWGTPPKGSLTKLAETDPEVKADAPSGPLSKLTGTKEPAWRDQAQAKSHADIAAKGDAKDMAVIKFMKSKGFTRDHLAAMTDDEVDKVAKEAGYKKGYSGDGGTSRTRATGKADLLKKWSD